MSAEEDLSCPVCYDIFKDPVVLSCCHSICKGCLEEFWRKKERRECPVCKVLNLYEPESNTALKILCESHLEEYRQRYAAGSEQHCSLHSQQLKLFCLEDKQPICLICQITPEHNTHECYPIDEAADHYRELNTALKPLQETLDCFSQVKQSYHKATAHIRRQATRTEQQIRNEFQKLYQFLRFEEAGRLLALRQEEEQKIQMLEEKLDEINSDMSSLLKLIRVIEEDMWTEDLLFIKNFEASVARAQCSFEDPLMVSGALIDEAKHLGNLAYRTWVKMKDIVQYSPVILDPNTAHKSLTLSEDLTSVTFDETHDLTHLPDNPERFKSSVCVLGSEGFDSGSHCWDVEVADRSLWEVGITTESNPKNARLFYSGVWSVESNCGFYTRSPARPKSPFSAEGGLERIRVKLDWDQGQVSFSDPLYDTEIKTFNYTFTEKVYPFFWSHCKRSPLKILPMSILPMTVLEMSNVRSD
ncbi:E3 ubiquitin-protein ligase TRIM35-like isoform X2 [Hemibagrus wyckioides]|uniref:E3 ubiquitin-protein ligase TRIM35-like isoform X2 n=1 Tax=Hemibagrus wyckioides TaxID=337641 RepID=UPI00266DAE8F|nr:E3 ubiquitin-protein ligase TRIM35-like isoform X2 [Hemibagrus wyckioides]